MRDRERKQAARRGDSKVKRSPSGVDLDQLPRPHSGQGQPGPGIRLFDISSKGEWGQRCVAFQVGERILADGFSESFRGR